MLFAVILAASVGTLTDDALSTSSKPDFAAYNEAKAKTGKSADAQVRLALWCERMA